MRPAGADLDLSFAPAFETAFGFVNAIEQQPNGKILVGGGFRSVNGHATACMLRLNADRSIDSSFKSTIRGQVLRIVVLPDEKILITGPFTAFSATTSRIGVARLNSDGSLDPTFNAGADGSTPRDVRLQPDGKILVAGEFFGFGGMSSTGIARLNADGSPDATFTSPFQLQFPTPNGAPPQSGVQAVGLQADGKIIVAGFMQFPGDGPGVRRPVVRLNTDGTIDASFSIPTISSNPTELDIQADGKIVLVGFFTSINFVSRNRVARLNADGTLDETFNPGTGASGLVNFVRILGSGKVLITGTFSTVNAAIRGGVAVLNSNGSLDDTFTPGTTTGSLFAALPIAGGYYVGGSFSRIAGADGRATLAMLDAGGAVDPGFVVTSYTHPSVRVIATQPDGKIIVGGFFNRLNGAARPALVRFNTNGTPDLTFDSGQLGAASVLRIVFQTDGKILVIGSGLSVNGGGAKTMVRLNANGSVDDTFTLAAITQISVGLAAAIQPDGKIVFSYQTTSTSPLTASGIVRLNSDGSLDGSFTGSFPSSRFESLAVLPNGQILAAGPFAFAYVSSQTGSEPHAGVVRLNSDGAHDRTFRSALTFDDTNVSAAYTMLVQPDGKILVGGRLFIGNAPNAVGVARLNSTGTIDGSFQTGSISSLLGVANVFAVHRTSDGKVLAGGFFDTYGGTARANLVRLESNGTVDQTFSANTDYTVSAVTTEANGSILIGGSFEKVNGVARTAIARLLTGSTVRAPFDFDGDGETDIGIFRPAGAASEWWVNRSSTGQTFALQFGAATDRIAPADYTGDGKTDIAFFRPSS
ncbi:MAG TPA: FG-GAP-like repeat-containing protein, partial [Pyrinomonadaceae bacterium]|nr:FG-GAP-like repeat-containing protein [Pyrinomonadaceae bacterium]